MCDLFHNRADHVCRLARASRPDRALLSQPLPQSPATLSRSRGCIAHPGDCNRRNERGSCATIACIRSSSRQFTLPLLPHRSTALSPLPATSSVLHFPTTSGATLSAIRTAVRATEEEAQAISLQLLPRPDGPVLKRNGLWAPQRRDGSCPSCHRCCSQQTQASTDWMLDLQGAASEVRRRRTILRELPQIESGVQKRRSSELH